MRAVLIGALSAAVGCSSSGGAAPDASSSLDATHHGSGALHDAKAVSDAGSVHDVEAGQMHDTASPPDAIRDASSHDVSDSGAADGPVSLVPEPNFQSCAQCGCGAKWEVLSGGATATTVVAPDAGTTLSCMVCATNVDEPSISVASPVVVPVTGTYSTFALARLAGDGGTIPVLFAYLEMTPDGGPGFPGGDVMEGPSIQVSANAWTPVTDTIQLTGGDKVLLALTVATPIAGAVGTCVYFDDVSLVLSQ